MSVKPTIRTNVPMIGDGSIEGSIVHRLAPIFNNIAAEISRLHQRLARLEAVGPGVQINYAPANISELKEAIDIIAPKVEATLDQEWVEEEKDGETPIPN